MIITTSTPISPNQYEVIKILQGYGNSNLSLWKRFRMDLMRHKNDTTGDEIRSRIFDEAVNDLIKKAIAINADAVISVGFTYVFGFGRVIAYGTAIKYTQPISEK